MLFRSIEDLGLEGDENVIIYRNDKGDGEEFINIYSGIRIMITTERTINGDRYKKLPENVDYVIVKNRVYEVKEEFDMIFFMSEERLKEYIQEAISQGKLNESNKKGNTLLIQVINNSDLINYISSYYDNLNDDEWTILSKYTPEPNIIKKYIENLKLYKPQDPQDKGEMFNHKIRETYFMFQLIGNQYFLILLIHLKNKMFYLNHN